MEHQVNGAPQAYTVSPCIKMDNIMDIIDDDMRLLNTFINQMDNLSKDIHRLTVHENSSPDIPDDYLNMPYDMDDLYLKAHISETKVSLVHSHLTATAKAFELICNSLIKTRMELNLAALENDDDDQLEPPERTARHTLNNKMVRLTQFHDQIIQTITNRLHCHRESPSGVSTSTQTSKPKVSTASTQYTHTMGVTTSTQTLKPKVSTTPPQHTHTMGTTSSTQTLDNISTYPRTTCSNPMDQDNDWTVVRTRKQKREIRKSVITTSPQCQQITTSNHATQCNASTLSTTTSKSTQCEQAFTSTIATQCNHRPTTSIKQSWSTTPMHSGDTPKQKTIISSQQMSDLSLDHDYTDTNNAHGLHIHDSENEDNNHCYENMSAPPPYKEVVTSKAYQRFTSQKAPQMANTSGTATQCNRKMPAGPLTKGTSTSDCYNIITCDITPSTDSIELANTNTKTTPISTKSRLMSGELNWDNSYDCNSNELPEDSPISNTLYNSSCILNDIFEASSASMLHPDHINAHSTNRHSNTNPFCPEHLELKGNKDHRSSQKSSSRVRSRSLPQGIHTNNACLPVKKGRNTCELELPLSPARLSVDYNLDYLFLTQNTLTPSPPSKNYFCSNQVISPGKPNSKLDYMKQLNRVCQ